MQAVIRKPEKQRTPAEQKIADDYFPGPAHRRRQDRGGHVRRRQADLPGAARQADPEVVAGGGAGLCPPSGRSRSITASSARRAYVLTSGDPERPEKDKPVEPGWPFSTAETDFREGRIEAFSDWLTAPENPLFARVAVNRLWQWHFGEGLQKSPSDFGKLGGRPRISHCSTGWPRSSSHRATA